MPSLVHFLPINFPCFSILLHEETLFSKKLWLVRKLCISYDALVFSSLLLDLAAVNDRDLKVACTYGYDIKGFL